MSQPDSLNIAKEAIRLALARELRVRPFPLRLRLLWTSMEPGATACFTADGHSDSGPVTVSGLCDVESGAITITSSGPARHMNNRKHSLTLWEILSHNERVIVHSSREDKQIYTWNRSATFQVWNDEGDGFWTGVATRTRYDVDTIERAQAFAREWHTEPEV